MGTYKGIDFNGHLDNLLVSLFENLVMPKSNDKSLSNRNKIKPYMTNGSPKESSFWRKKIIKELGKLPSSHRRTAFRHQLESILPKVNNSGNIKLTPNGFEYRSNTKISLVDREAMRLARRQYSKVIEKQLRRMDI